MSSRARIALLALLVAGGAVWAAGRGRPPSPRPLRLCSTRHVTPVVRPGAALRGVRHLGAPHPALAALTRGETTWIGTASAGLLRYDARLWSDPARARPTLAVGVAQGLPSPRIYDLALHPTRTDELLVATARGLARLDAQSGRVQGVLLRGREVLALAFPLAGADDGLYRVDGDAAHRIPGTAGLVTRRIVPCGDWLLTVGSLPLLIQRDGWVEPRPDLGGTRSAACCPDKTLWLGAHDGLRWLDQSAVARRAAWERHTPTLACDRQGALLLGTFAEGALRRPAGEDRLRRLLRRGHVSLLHAPAPGLTLVGTDDGLFVVRGRARRVPLDGPPTGLVVALARRGDELWVGTFDGGLAVRDGHGWQPVRLFDRRITQLLVGPRGRMWVGTASGLAVERGPGSRRLTRFRDPRGWLGRHVNLLRLVGQEVWVGVHPGLVSIEGQRLSYRGALGHDADAGLLGPTVNGLARTEDRLWIGGTDGLTRLGPAGLFALSDTNAALPDNWINDVRAAGETVHVLTLAAGLLEISPAGAVVTHTRGLMTSPSGMSLLGGRPLFGTAGRGLALVTPGGITTYGPEQGLASATVSALLVDAGADRLWLGGDAGVEIIDHARRELAPPTTNREEGT